MSAPDELDRLAAEQIDDRDLRELSRVATMYDRADPVPGGLVERIKFGITLDALHMEIAELQRSEHLAGVRSDDVTSAQTITFTSSALTIMITVTPTSADRTRIDGWAAPGQGVRVELRTSAGTVSTIADEDGRFVLDDVERGLAQLVVHPAGDGAAAVITPSIEI
jgi:hypothetical protein